MMKTENYVEDDSHDTICTVLNRIFDGVAVRESIIQFWTSRRDHLSSIPEREVVST
ncbi:MAG: hypothetical protein GF411_18095 [Candidatus Lokiarchaeota archaeon]|nr:hypothetical protein [Candidatus Lokiarchaeota archaeon]